MIRFIPLGGADNIGANAYYLYIDGTGILLDCGMDPGEKGIKALPKFSMLDTLPIDYVVITHAHHDHIGALPFLIKKFPYIKIISTKQTQEIAALTLQNSSRILKEELGDDHSLQMIDTAEIDLLIRSIIPLGYQIPYNLKGFSHEEDDPVSIEFFDAGHILGSASVLITYKDIRIFYTGDINLASQSLMNGAVLPEKPVDILLLESTYGAADSKMIGGWKHNADRFALSINRIVNAGASVMIPVFSLGKLQEILHLIIKLQLKNKISEAEVYFGGIGKAICSVYDLNQYLVKRNDKNFEFKNVQIKDYQLVKDFTEFTKNPSIILASSGMMIKGTYSYNLAKYLLRQKDFGIFTVGYMDPGSPGFQIQNAAKGDIINFEEERFEIKCEIERFYFSSHSRREELVEIVDRLKPAKTILLHGEPEAKSLLGYNILEKFKTLSLFSAEIGKEIILS